MKAGARKNQQCNNTTGRYPGILLPVKAIVKKQVTNCLLFNPNNTKLCV